MFKNLVRRMLLYIIIPFLVCYIALVAWVAINQERLVYFPSHVLPITPADRGFYYEDAWMQTSDDLTIHGWFVPMPGARGTVLFFHGNGDTVSSASSAIPFFYRLGLNCFFVDYRGYGKSGGKPGEEGTYRDAEAAWHYLVETRQIPTSQIVVLGHSLGGGVASWLAQHYPPAGLILQETFTSLPDVGVVHYPFLPVHLFARNRYPTRERLPQIHVPILIVHGRDDTLIPFNQGKMLYASANEPKTFLEVSGGHGASMSTAAYRDAVTIFIDHLFPAQ